MKFGPVRLDEAEGAILAHSVSAGGRTWRKAHRLTADDISAMRAAGLDEVVAAVLAEGDVGEDDAATRIAAALGGKGIEIKPAATGRVNLHAATAGVFRVDRASVEAINSVDPAITLATLPEFETVERGRMVATVKIIPFAVAADLVGRAAAIAGGTDVFSVEGFTPHSVGMVQTMLSSLKASVLDKTARLTQERLARSGSMVRSEVRTPHSAAEVASAIARLARDNDLVLVFGASAMADPDDVIPAAIRLAGGSVERVGMPVDPGNLLILGSVGKTTVIGAPGCARSPKLNGFDWVLDRVLAGVPVAGRDIAAMGVGGLLMEIPTRPQPRETERRPAGRPSVHALLLAAGRSRRMGGPNKLLALFDGVPLVRRAADALAASKAGALHVVTGHQAELVRAALAGTAANLVDNPAFKTGLASSLKAGIAALPAQADAALVALGDMPGLSVDDFDRLIEAFASAGGLAVVRATHRGKRGNPVVLPRALFDAVARLEGDTGARAIVEGSGLPIIDVEIGEAASLDIDTPEAMRRAGGLLPD